MNPETKLTHVDESGAARMVDVTRKPISRRAATAQGEVRMAASTVARIRDNQMAKGDVLAVARVAGVQAAKQCGGLIPLCHPLPLTHIDVRCELPDTEDRVRIEATARIEARTGVEMEALAAVSVAALTVYDMCKAVDKSMVIGDIALVAKTKEPVAETR